MERVLVVGANGAGKTAFAKALAEKTGLPLVHVDRLYWLEGWKARPQEELAALLRAECQKPRWIIEGNRQASIEERLCRADTVFFFDFSPTLCTWRAIKRSFRNRGLPVSDRAGNPEGFRWRFYWSVFWGTKRQCRKLRASLKKSNAQVIVFTKPRQARRYTSIYIGELDRPAAP